MAPAPSKPPAYRYADLPASPLLPELTEAEATELLGMEREEIEVEDILQFRALARVRL